MADVQYDTKFSANGDHEIEDLFGRDLYSKMVNLVFKDVAKISGAFDPESTSMLGKAAKSWIEAGGRSGKDIHEVAGAFRNFIREGSFEIPDFVKTRFTALIGAISDATSGAETKSQ